MGGALLAIEQAAHHMAFHDHPIAHPCRRVGEQGIESGARLKGKADHVVLRNRAGGGYWH
jgi:hypothetical protein